MNIIKLQKIYNFYKIIYLKKFNNTQKNLVLFKYLLLIFIFLSF